MTLPQPNSDAAWIADGVRHQIMLRVLPVQRHDMLGPLSVVRMALAVVRRRLSQAVSLATPEAAVGDEHAVRASAAGPDWPGVQVKLGEVEGQVAEVVGAVAVLRWWDGMHRTPPLPVAEAAAQCVALVQLAMSLRSQQLALQPPALQPPARSGRVARDGLGLPVPAVHHALLGLMVHATEALPQTKQWRLSWDGTAFLLQPQPAAVTPPEPTPEPTPADPTGMDGDVTLRPLSAAALETLLCTLGWALERQPGGWRLAWPVGLQPSAEPALASFTR